MTISFQTSYFKGMDDKTLFTKILGIKLPWFITRIEADTLKERVDIYIDHEPDIRVACPECGGFYAMHDHSPKRVYRHLNTCHLSTFIHVCLPRVKCPEHGVKQIVSEFGENNSEMTFALEKFVIELAQECSTSAIERLYGLSWDSGWNVVERAVARGFSRKEHKVPAHIGVDEKSFANGHKYETLVYDIDRGTVEFVFDERQQESLEAYYSQFSKQELSGIKAIAMDMWDAFIAATKAFVPDAERKIVFDRFHVMRYVVDAVDKVRKEENDMLQKQGISILKGTKYFWLYSKENIPAFRAEEFSELRNQDLKVSRAWSIKENIRNLWNYQSEGWMRRYFKKWYWWATHSRLKPMIKAAKTLKNHIDNIVTYASHKITNALAEGMNSRIEKVKRMACGFRNREHYKKAIYFHCGGLDLYPYPPVNPSLKFKIC